MTIAPPVVYFGICHRAVSKAESRLAWTQQMVNAERATYFELFSDSRNLRDCRLAMPFSDKTKICREHLDRIADARTFLAKLSVNGYDPREINAAYAEALERLRRVAGNEYADLAESQHRTGLPARWNVAPDAHEQVRVRVPKEP
jgi:hypothetical protein